jgi:Ser/Thr protein kinase RdoA (MazF antagonist)
MDDLLSLYERRLGIQGASFQRIDHRDAMVAMVYLVTLPAGKQFILKRCVRSFDYFHEVFFLNFFAGKLPVPHIFEAIPPDTSLDGVILMEYLPGSLLSNIILTDHLAFEIGKLLAQVHINRTEGYGDLLQKNELRTDPKFYFTLKFQEGLEECSEHLPAALIEKCRLYYDQHISLLSSLDGPCIVHRDFRPGNLIVHEGKIQGLIDWSACRASFAEEDFCFLMHGKRPISVEMTKSFLSGYATIRPVPNYEAIMPLLRLSKAVAAIGFTVKRRTWANVHSDFYLANREFLEMIF